MAPRPRLALISVLLVCLWIIPLAGAEGQTGLPAWGTEPSPNAGAADFLSGISATEPGCGPDSRVVTVVAGQTLEENFHINCNPQWTGRY